MLVIFCTLSLELLPSQRTNVSVAEFNGLGFEGIISDM